jgi:heme oxygenase
MHAHDGFDSIKSGTIDKRSYVLLLRRLYGFYLPFEQRADLCNDRSSWLGSDLTALGVASEDFGGIPNCSQTPQLDTPNRRLGALYVVAGSALGGRELSRGLDSVLGKGVTSGRTFFLGYGDRTGEVWRECLTSLALASGRSGASAEIIGAAVETFAAFEQWAAGWKDETNG